MFINAKSDTFHKAYRLGLLLGVLLLPLVLLMPAATSAQESFKRPSYGESGQPSAEWTRGEVRRVAENLQDVITALSAESSLSSREVDQYQRELTAIYRDLDSLQRRLDTGSTPGDRPNQEWRPYSSFTRDIRPAGARFNGWGDSADISFELASRGVIHLMIDNYRYEADLVIQRAYQGGVEVAVQSRENGDVILTVRDDNGEHEFLVQQGGLGPVYLRGIASGGQTPTSSWQPYPYAKREVWPEGQRFTSWRESANVDFTLGQRGAIVLNIDNVAYQARWTIEDAYEGGVEARVHSSQDGDVILVVSDDRGTREYLVQDGGLGQIYWRIREDFAPPRRTAQ